MVGARRVHGVDRRVGWPSLKHLGWAGLERRPTPCRPKIERSCLLSDARDARSGSPRRGVTGVEPGRGHASRRRGRGKVGRDDSLAAGETLEPDEAGEPSGEDGEGQCWMRSIQAGSSRYQEDLGGAVRSGCRGRCVETRERFEVLTNDRTGGRCSWAYETLGQGGAQDERVMESRVEE